MKRLVLPKIKTKELEKRIAEMESGEVKTYSWDESNGLKRNMAGLEDVMSGVAYRAFS